jgi:hypothetical protein
VEVERQADAEQAGGADRHVRVAGKVEVDLHRVGERTAPCLAHREQSFIGRGGVEDAGGDARDVVCDDDFLEQADQQDGGADGGIDPAVVAPGLAHELRHHLLVVDDRPGDELGEEGDEEQVVGEVVFAGLAAVGIDEVGDLLEGEEGNAERQHDVRQVEVEAGQSLDGAVEEAGVLEPAEQAEVGGDAEGEHQPGRREPAGGGSGGSAIRAPCGEEAAEVIVADAGAADQEQVDRFPPAVIEERGDHQPAEGRPQESAPAEQQEAQQRERQEEDQEGVGVEDHPAGGVREDWTAWGGGVQNREKGGRYRIGGRDRFPNGPADGVPLGENP